MHFCSLNWSFSAKKSKKTPDSFGDKNEMNTFEIVDFTNFSYLNITRTI